VKHSDDAGSGHADQSDASAKPGQLTRAKRNGDQKTTMVEQYKAAYEANSNIESSTAR
jgi:hypothetical protein